jgi:hypothetical protein
MKTRAFPMSHKLKQKIMPFTHTPGPRVWLPYTFWAMRIFPSRLEFYDCSKDRLNLCATLEWTLMCRVEGFNVELNLERGYVSIEGNDGESFFRFIVLASENLNPILYLKKRRGNCIYTTSEMKIEVGASFELIDKQWVLSSLNPLLPRKLSTTSQIYLGSDKQQNWDQVYSSNDPKRWVPLLCRSRYFWPKGLREQTYKSQAYLDLMESLLNIAPRKLWDRLMDYAMTHCSGLLLSSWEDIHYSCGKQWKSEKGLSSLVPLCLLTLGFEHLLYSLDDNQLRLLPKMTPEIACGKLSNLQIGGFSISYEWSRERLKKVKISSLNQQKIELVFPKAIRGGRVRIEGGGGAQNFQGHCFELSRIQAKSIELDRFQY